MDPKTDVRERLASKRAGVRWEARRRSLARPGLRPTKPSTERTLDQTRVLVLASGAGIASPSRSWSRRRWSGNCGL